MFKKLLEPILLLVAFWTIICLASNTASAQSLGPEGLPDPDLLPGGNLVMMSKAVGCGLGSEMREKLKSEHGETDETIVGFSNLPPTGIGERTMVVMILRSPTKGTWTILEQHVSGTACMLAAGVTMDFTPKEPERKI